MDLFNCRNLWGLNNYASASIPAFHYHGGNRTASSEAVQNEHDIAACHPPENADAEFIISHHGDRALRVGQRQLSPLSGKRDSR